ncbi:hypothetical protein IC582_021079 [Cucumis melo]
MTARVVPATACSGVALSSSHSVPSLSETWRYQTGTRTIAISSATIAVSSLSLPGINLPQKIMLSDPE